MDSVTGEGILYRKTEKFGEILGVQESKFPLIFATL
jgi:hypothetical protein